MGSVPARGRFDVSSSVHHSGSRIRSGEFIPAFYNVIVVAFITSIVMLWRISRSPFGLALKAIRENETRAAHIGIPVRQYRWYAFILSGVFMGVAGGLYGQLARQITPEQLHWLFSAQLVLATVLGGTRQFLGPVLGAFAFIGLDEVASHWTVGRNLASAFCSSSSFLLCREVWRAGSLI